MRPYARCDKPQLKTVSRHIPHQRCILTYGGPLKIGAGDEALCESLWKIGRRERPTIDICAREQCVRCRLCRIIGEVVRIEYILDGIAIARYPSVVSEAPGVPQDVLQEKPVRACRNTVHGVVRTHDASDFGIANARLERRQVEVGEILLSDLRVKAVADDPLPVVHVVRSEMLAVRHDLEVWLGVEAALKADDEVVDILL